MSITFQNSNYFIKETGATVTCGCEKTIHGTFATYGEAMAMADTLNYEGGVETECCGSQTFPVLTYEGEDLSVNLSNVNAWRVLELLRIAPDYCGSVPAVEMAERASAVFVLDEIRADMLAVAAGLRDGAYVRSVAERLMRLAAADLQAEVTWC